MRSVVYATGSWTKKCMKDIGKWWVARKSTESPVDIDVIPSIELNSSSEISLEAVKVQGWDWSAVISNDSGELVVVDEYKAVTLREHTCDVDESEDDEHGCLGCKAIKKGPPLSPKTTQSDQNSKDEVCKLHHILFPDLEPRFSIQLVHFDQSRPLGGFLGGKEECIGVFTDLSAAGSLAKRLQEHQRLDNVDYLELDEVFWDVDTKNHLARPQTEDGLHLFHSLETLVVSRGAVNKKVEGQDLYQDDELINTLEKQEELRKAFGGYFERKHQNYPACCVPEILIRNPFVEIKSEDGASSGEFVEMTGVETEEGASTVE